MLRRLSVRSCDLQIHTLIAHYSQTSEEGTLWDRSLCPLFGGCPFLGGWSLFSVLSHNMNSGDLQHQNNGYCKRCFMLGVLLLCEGLPCLQESVGACKRGGFTSHTGSNKSSGQAHSSNLQRRYFCRPCATTWLPDRRSF